MVSKVSSVLRCGGEPCVGKNVDCLSGRLGRSSFAGYVSLDRGGHSLALVHAVWHARTHTP